MTLEEWRELRPGVYLHLYLPRLLIVPLEVVWSEGSSEPYTVQQLDTMVQYMLDWANRVDAEASTLNLTRREVTVTEEVSYARR